VGVREQHSPSGHPEQRPIVAIPWMITKPLPYPPGTLMKQAGNLIDGTDTSAGHDAHFSYHAALIEGGDNRSVARSAHDRAHMEVLW
jgi:hypothetical protein